LIVGGPETSEVLMADGKLKIPRMALAVLVLGGACGDDENNDSGDDAGGHDEHDGGGHDEHDAGGGGGDAGAGGGDGGGGGDTIDVSDARIQKVARDFCAQGFQCDVEEVVGNFDDEAECRADSVSYWEDYLPTLGEACIDAQLDLYACAALLSCDEAVDDECSDQVDKTAELCSEG
jgi:hypothetical protein